jgi:DNA-binding Lrp family transcriptional regulator
MVELSEESVVFLRVKSGEVERALTELRRNPAVKEAEAVMGLYDVAVTGAFRSWEDLRQFQAEVEAKDFCEESAAHPGFENWRREGEAEAPMSGWTLIRAVDAQKAMKDLQRIPSVHRIVATAGEYNLLVRVGAKDAGSFHDAVVRDIQKVHGVRRTETRPSLKRA